MSYLDRIACKNCFQNSVFRRSKNPAHYEDRKLSETDTAPVAVSCPECKHVYMYEYQETTPTLWPELQGQAATHQKYPSAAFVPLVCDVEDCDTELVVIAARAAGIPLEAVLAEVPSWTLHDLKCPEGHPILVPKIGGGG
jgi:hypothetical protein